LPSWRPAASHPWLSNAFEQGRGVDLKGVGQARDEPHRQLFRSPRFDPPQLLQWYPQERSELDLREAAAAACVRQLGPDGSQEQVDSLACRSVWQPNVLLCDGIVLH